MNEILYADDLVLMSKRNREFKREIFNMERDV